MLERRFFKINSVDYATRDRIAEIIKSNLSGRRDIAFAYLHGSFAEGLSFRDIDVAVFMARGIKEMELESDLSYELSEKTGYPVEVRVINSAPVAFQMAVLRKGHVLISNADESRTDFIENTGKKYREYAHFRNIIAGPG